MMEHRLIVLAIVTFCRPNLVQRNLIPFVITSEPVPVVGDWSVNWSGDRRRRVVERSHAPQISIATPIGFAFEYRDNRDACVVVIFSHFFLANGLCLVHFSTCDLKSDIGAYSDRLLFLVGLTG